MCTNSSAGKCICGLSAPHTAHCWDHSWICVVEKSEENSIREEREICRENRICREKGEHLEEPAAKGGKSTAGSNSEQRIDDEVALHYERVQHEEELHYDSVDVPRQGCVSRVDGGGIRSGGDHYYGIDAAENFQMDGVGHGTKKKDQQDDQPKGTPDAVYAAVDKGKKKKQGKTQGGASATTTQGIYTEEQHYECSSVFGQDWVGNWVGEKPRGNHGDAG